KVVAAAVAEFVHVQAVEQGVGADARGFVVQPVEPTEIFHHLARGEARIERGCGGEESEGSANLLWLTLNVEACDGGRSRSGLEYGGQHAKCGGLARAVGSQQSVNATRLAAEGHSVNGSNAAAFAVVEFLAEVLRKD